MKNGYEFRKKRSNLDPFDFQKVMAKLHPDGRLLTPMTLCSTEFSEFKAWCGRKSGFTFKTEYRIHPVYRSSGYKKLTSDIQGVTLALGIDFSQ